MHPIYGEKNGSNKIDKYGCVHVCMSMDKFMYGYVYVYMFVHVCNKSHPSMVHGFTLTSINYYEDFTDLRLSPKESNKDIVIVTFDERLMYTNG